MQSSCLATICLAPCPGDTVIDLCAAPGMKTTHIASMLKNKGLVYYMYIYTYHTCLDGILVSCSLPQTPSRVLQEMTLCGHLRAFKWVVGFPGTPWGTKNQTPHVNLFQYNIMCFVGLHCSSFKFHSALRPVGHLHWE